MSLSDYHVFAIPTAIKDLEVGISFSELENDLGGGYYAQVLFGSANGERDWRLTMPTLTGTLDRTVTGINGETLSWEEYIWDLFCEQKVNGTPFALQDIRTGNYYLVRFADKKLTYSRMLVKLYSTGLELKQWRISGETVWQASELTGIQGWYSNESAWPAPFPGGWGNVVGLGEGVGTLVNTGNVAQTGTQNGLPILQFNVGATNDGFLLSESSFTDIASAGLKEAFLVMKMREATFSNNAGVLTTESTAAALVGNTGTTKFFDLGLTNFEYRLNNVLYTASNQQAPMNAWGIVHVRKTSGVFFNGKVQIGKDRDFAGRFAEMDVAEVLLFDSLQPMNIRREIIEHLAVRWAITV